MKKFLFFISLYVLSAISGRSQQTDRAFQYPVPPESLETLEERSTFLAEHFWDRCNMKSIFSARKKFEESFGDYISILPYADSTAVFKSIEKLIKSVKGNQGNMRTMVEVAESKMYSDSAEYPYDLIFIPFAQAAVDHAGLSKPEKERMARIVSQLSHSQPGMKLPEFNMQLIDGSLKNLSDVEGSYILIMIDEPDNFDNMMARTRLATDYGLNELIKDGYIRVISLYPGLPDQEWYERASSYPENWIVAASAEADALFDQRIQPQFYYANKDKVILSKTLLAENLVEAFRAVHANQQKIKTERERLRKEAELNYNKSKQ